MLRSWNSTHGHMARLHKWRKYATSLLHHQGILTGCGSGVIYKKSELLFKGYLLLLKIHSLGHLVKLFQKIQIEFKICFFAKIVLTWAQEIISHEPFQKCNSNCNKIWWRTTWSVYLFLKTSLFGILKGSRLAEPNIVCCPKSKNWSILVFWVGWSVIRRELASWHVTTRAHVKSWARTLRLVSL